MKALVVDDDPTTRIVLQEILSEYAEVHSSLDGSEAVLAYGRALECGEPYDLICMDVLMPVMGGLEALKLIRQKEEARGSSGPRATKVIITTAADDADTISQAFRELCDAYVVKPIDAEEFIDVVGCLFPIKRRTSLS
jgi:two-component system chemotaxis response regulator CheY